MTHLPADWELVRTVKRPREHLELAGGVADVVALLCVADLTLLGVDERTQ